MTPKTLVSAVAISAAAVALWGCATSKSVADGGPLPDQTCAGNSCSVTIYHNAFGPVRAPNTLYVSVGSGPLTVTWTISSATGTHFDRDKGIEFADPNFTCSRDATWSQVYTCVGTNLQNRKYKYTINPRGIGAEPLDPVIQNG